jgi:hypothetical protein
MFRSRKLGLRVSSILFVAATALAMGGCASTGATHGRAVAKNTTPSPMYHGASVETFPGLSGSAPTSDVERNSVTVH